MAALDDLIAKYASQYGLDPATLRAFVKIESGGDPNARTGSYSGLLQLSRPEFNRYGGGEITNPEDNLRAGAAKLADESKAFQQQYGRAPTATDLYLQHQQGQGGYAAHSANPEGLAWQNMASTAEGREKGPGWARQAIWGNVPDDVKDRYGSVDNLTSKDFVGLWNDKVNRMTGGELAPMQTAAAPAPVKDEKGNDMGGLLAMLAGGGMNMGAFGGGGAAVPSMASAADPGSISGMFGSLGGGFTGKGGGGGDNLKMATEAMNSAAKEDPDAAPKLARKPFDMQQLASMLSKSGYLGTARPQQPGGMV